MPISPRGSSSLQSCRSELSAFVVRLRRTLPRDARFTDRGSRVRTAPRPHAYMLPTGRLWGDRSAGTSRSDAEADRVGDRCSLQYPSSLKRAIGLVPSGSTEPTIEFRSIEARISKPSRERIRSLEELGPMVERTFGKRVGSGLPDARTKSPAPSRAARVSESEPPRADASALPSPPKTNRRPSPEDDELKQWKDARKRERPFKLPWRQLSLMASLSFGIASFVLPASVNDTVGWLLDLLAVAAFLAWLDGRRRRRHDSEIPFRSTAEG